jgi:hypothetical protein
MNIQEQKAVRARMIEWAEICIRNNWNPAVVIALGADNHAEFFATLTPRSIRDLLVQSFEVMPSDEELEKQYANHIKRN